LLIKKMLYEDRYTVEGVRQKLGNRLIPCERFSREDIIEKIRYKLKEILRMLS